jgi:uncharacterized protein (TIGR02421 family)
MTETASTGSGLVEVVRARLGAGKSVRRNLPGGGRLHIDRPLPFLCLYRAPIDRPDPGTAELVRTQASYLVTTDDPRRHRELAQLADGVVQVLADASGACLVLELWAGPDPGAEPPAARIVTPGEATTVAVLADALRAMSTPFGTLEVEVVTGGDPAPPGARPLISADRAAHTGILLVGLEVPPIYRSPVALYPIALRALSVELASALQQGFFEFTRVQTSAPPEHYQMMGRRRILRAVRQADWELAEIEASFDSLLDVTPVNTAEAWQEFCDSGQERAPALRYRMLAIDPELVKRRLYDLPLEKLEDPVLALLLRDKRRELDRRLGLLEERDGPRFLPGSIQHHGGVDDSLLAEAGSILATVQPSAKVDSRPLCHGAELAARARAELDHYERLHGPLGVSVQLRDDIPALVVSHGDLLVPERLAVSTGRVDALIQHEIGTHVLTYENGSSQPLRLFAAGLAGYEQLQEGLAMFAEYLAGGLDRNRLRIIAARVVAVRRLIEGATFPAVVAEMTGQHRLPLRAAFGLAVRVFRGGGLTKDAIYLRGLLQLLDYLASGGALEPLLVGKIAVEQVPLVEELLRRQILRPPRLTPRWLGAAGAEARLARAREGLRPIDLIEPTESRSTG